MKPSYSREQVLICNMFGRAPSEVFKGEKQSPIIVPFKDMQQTVMDMINEDIGKKDLKQLATHKDNLEKERKTQQEIVKKKDYADKGKVAKAEEIVKLIDKSISKIDAKMTDIEKSQKQEAQSRQVDISKTSEMRAKLLLIGEAEGKDKVISDIDKLQKLDPSDKSEKTEAERASLIKSIDDGYGLIDRAVTAKEMTKKRKDNLNGISIMKANAELKLKTDPSDADAKAFMTLLEKYNNSRGSVDEKSIVDQMSATINGARTGAAFAKLLAEKDRLEMDNLETKYINTAKDADLDSIIPKLASANGQYPATVVAGVENMAELLKRKYGKQLTDNQTAYIANAMKRNENVLGLLTNTLVFNQKVNGTKGGNDSVKDNRFLEYNANPTDQFVEEAVKNYAVDRTGQKDPLSEVIAVGATESDKMKETANRIKREGQNKAVEDGTAGRLPEINAGIQKNNEAIEKSRSVITGGISEFAKAENQLKERKSLDKYDTTMTNATAIMSGLEKRINTERMTEEDRKKLKSYYYKIKSAHDTAKREKENEEEKMEKLSSVAMAMKENAKLEKERVAEVKKYSPAPVVNITNKTVYDSPQQMSQVAIDKLMAGQVAKATKEADPKMLEQLIKSQERIVQSISKDAPNYGKEIASLEGLKNEYALKTGTVRNTAVASSSEPSAKPEKQEPVVAKKELSDDEVTAKLNEARMDTVAISKGLGKDMRSLFLSRANEKIYKRDVSGLMSVNNEYSSFMSDSPDKSHVEQQAEKDKQDEKTKSERIASRVKEMEIADNKARATPKTIAEFENRKKDIVSSLPAEAIAKSSLIMKKPYDAEKTPLDNMNAIDEIYSGIKKEMQIARDSKDKSQDDAGKEFVKLMKSKGVNPKDSEVSAIVKKIRDAKERDAIENAPREVASVEPEQKKAESVSSAVGKTVGSILATGKKNLSSVYEGAKAVGSVGADSLAETGKAVAGAVSGTGKDIIRGAVEQFDAPAVLKSSKERLLRIAEQIKNDRSKPMVLEMISNMKSPEEEAFVYSQIKSILDLQDAMPDSEGVKNTAIATSPTE